MKELTIKEKQLLLKDLCGRLPYGIKVLNIAEGVNEVCELDSIMTSRKCKDKIFVSLTLPDDSIMTGIEMLKPYLRPMSSMTEEEKKEFNSLINGVEERCINAYGKGGYTLAFTEVNDWLNAHHFDYRRLIEKGLALEAPEGMYEY